MSCLNLSIHQRFGTAELCTIENARAKLQNEAARIVTGLTGLVSLVNLYGNVDGNLYLAAKKDKKKKCFMYRCKRSSSFIYI